MMDRVVTRSDMSPDLPPEDIAPADQVFAARSEGGVRRVPGAAVSALRAVRQAAPRTLTGAIALQVASAGLVIVQLLAVKLLVGELLGIAQQPDESVAAA